MNAFFTKSDIGWSTEANTPSGSNNVFVDVKRGGERDLAHGLIHAFGISSARYGFYIAAEIANEMAKFTMNYGTPMYSDARTPVTYVYRAGITVKRPYSITRFDILRDGARKYRAQ